VFRHFRPEIEARIASYRARRPHAQDARMIAAQAHCAFGLRRLLNRRAKSSTTSPPMRPARIFD